MAQNQQSEEGEFQGHYQQIRADLKKVIITNLLIIVLLVALYFVNQKFSLLEDIQKFF